MRRIRIHLMWIRARAGAFQCGRAMQRRRWRAILAAAGGGGGAGRMPVEPEGAALDWRGVGGSATALPVTSWRRRVRICRRRLSNDRTKGTVCTWPCNIYVSSYVTHVPALGSACVSQDCASGRSGQSLDGSRAEHLSIPIPENAEKCPSQRFFSLGNMSRGEAGY